MYHDILTAQPPDTQVVFTHSSTHSQPASTPITLHKPHCPPGHQEPLALKADHQSLSHLLSRQLLHLPPGFVAALSQAPLPAPSLHNTKTLGVLRALSWAHFSLNTPIYPIALSLSRKMPPKFITLAQDLISVLQMQIYHHLLNFHLKFT